MKQVTINNERYTVVKPLHKTTTMRTMAIGQGSSKHASCDHQELIVTTTYTFVAADEAGHQSQQQMVFTYDILMSYGVAFMCLRNGRLYAINTNHQLWSVPTARRYLARFAAYHLNGYYSDVDTVTNLKRLYAGEQRIITFDQATSTYRCSYDPIAIQPEESGAAFVH